MRIFLYYEESKYKDKVFFRIGEEPVNKPTVKKMNSFKPLFENSDKEAPEVSFGPIGAYDFIHAKYETEQEKSAFSVIKPEFKEEVDKYFGDTIFFHIHNYVEINYVARGEICYLVNGECITLRENDFIVIGSKIPHAWSEIKKGTLMQFIFADLNFLALPSYYASEGENVAEVFNDDFYIKIDKEHQLYEQVNSIFKNIIRENKEKKHYYLSILRIDVSKLIFVISRNFVKKQPKLKEVHNLDTIDLAMKYIDENCSKKLSLSEVAKKVYLNKNYLSDYFKNRLEINFSDYLTRVRMVKASQLLMNPDYKIIDIAHECGYASVANFNTVFRKTFFCTSSEYRRKLESNSVI